MHIHGQQTSGRSQVFRQDDDYNGIVVVDSIHHLVHEGKSFSLSRRATIGAGTIDYVRLATPDTSKRLHFEVTVFGNAALTMQLFEGTSWTHVGGNVLTPVNRERNSSATSGATICHTPAGSGDGTAIFDTSIPANQASAQAFLAGRREFILKQNTAYLIKVTGANGNIITVNMEWYEI
jgi:hypothetical protein